jgi:hypothetical protein
MDDYGRRQWMLFKQALMKILLQMTGLPKELVDCPTIWVIGTILGVTKDANMRFTCASTIGNRVIFGSQNYFWRFILGR